MDSKFLLLLQQLIWGAERPPLSTTHFALSPRLHSQAMRAVPLFPTSEILPERFRALKSRAGSSPASSFKAEIHFLSLVENSERETDC